MDNLDRQTLTPKQLAAIKELENAFCACKRVNLRMVAYNSALIAVSNTQEFRDNRENESGWNWLCYFGSDVDHHGVITDHGSD